MSSGGAACGAARGTGAECRKFAPNIFNKSKCSSCFKQKEEHSAEALESNRATRKISKCGYLFVAPGWDFSNPLNRTKRWQRRWFVLYDDGELTYSVDEHPETVPQARIDMTRVLEVAAAEDITGHPYSLAITSPEGVTFVKGTCREEARWWADVLQVYSRNKGRHKRNATFPGGQATILQITPAIRSNTPNPSRPRFNSCRSEPRNCSNSWVPDARKELHGSAFSSIGSSAETSEKPPKHSLAVSCERESARNASPLRPAPCENGAAQSSTLGATSSGINEQAASAGNANLGLCSEKPPIGKGSSCADSDRPYKDQPASSASPPTRDKHRAEDKARKRMMNQQQAERTLSIGSADKIDEDACRRILLEHEREREGKLRDIAASLTQPRTRRSKPRSSEPTRDVVDAANVNHEKLIRGDPDGCGLDISGTRYSPTSELRVDLPAEDLLNIKKGWLMKENTNKEWSKHWFVLRGCGLMYYRDPTAEDKGIMDGVIDLNSVTAVTLVQVARNYGFQTVTWDARGSTVLSAVTAGIRSSWMSAIRRAANLPDPEHPLESHVLVPETQQQQQQQQQEAITQSPTVSLGEREKESMMATTPVTPRSVLFSSDEEYRTASEGGRRESGDWSELPVSPPLTRSGDWSLTLKASSWSDSTKHEWSELPPSPPLTRTALSRVKARSRSSSRSRVYKRSRSSPPSSRRSTLDSVKSEDLMMACCELNEELEQSNGHLSGKDCLSKSSSESPFIVDLLESQLTMLRQQIDKNQSQPNSLLVIVERQENEIEALKSQLNSAKTELVGAEKELSRLRQQRAEASIREKQLDELLATLEKTEQQRNKYLEDLDKMKKLYAREKELLECKLLETEAILRESTERCEMLSNELSSSHATVEQLQAEITALTDRLSQGIEENERLYSRVRELEGKNSLSSSRERGRSFDSLSDLTNIDLDLDLNALDKERVMEEYEELRSRFEKAILEIRAMRKELREAHATQDVLELEIFAHKQEAARDNESNQAQVHLMAARIQDLTSKLAGSEKQVRTLKQKLTKMETRDKRRSLSLKGRESLQISQEVEDKLLDLENKISALERSKNIRVPVTAETISKECSPNAKKERKRENRSLDRNRLRRKSLDSATSSEPLKVLIRLSTLETKVASATENLISDVEKDSSECSEVSASSTCEVSLEVLSRLKKFERAVAKAKRRLEKCLGASQAEEKAEKCLRVVNEILESCAECKKSQSNPQTLESVGVVVSKLETILRDKMCELMKRRQELIQTGKLDEKEKIKLIAERIAFEFIILRQIKSAMERTFDKSIVLSELVETSQLISNLKFKLNGTKPKTYQNTSYIQYLTKVLANKLVLIGGVPKTVENSMEISAAQAEALNFLLQKQKEVNEIVNNYKNDKLKHLAEALAVETFNISEQKELNKQPTYSDNKVVKDKRIQEAWVLAQETISKELVQVEVSRFIMRCGQMYEQNISSITDTCLNFDTLENFDPETWADKAHAILRREMELSVRELTCAYEECIVRLKQTRNDANVHYNSRQLLSEYADVIAQKALIDARIILFQESAKDKVAFTGKTFVSRLIQQEDILSNLLDEDYNFENNLIYDAEYVYLYQQFSKDCEEKIFNKHRTEDQIKNVAQTLADMADEVDVLKQCLYERANLKEENIEWPKISTLAADWNSICEKCSQIREQIRQLTDHMKNVMCKQCEQLQDKIQFLTIEHAKKIEELRKNQEKDIMDIRGEWDNQKNSLATQYEHEAANLRERARKLEDRLNAMDSEHSAHVNELRAAYQRTISAELDTDAETRKRYKEEIKQLRALCEKGLLAMENSHRRIISELEEKHRQEIENLRIEKEQALSEETQATLAALDAMRKAHEHEVQKEIAKFKQEFIKQVQAREDIGVLHKEHEQEMEEIKQEILSLSAKYSSKCVESAALEEKVGTLTKQVAQAQQHIMQLDARNKQLRAHLALETNSSNLNETIQLLKGRDIEIAEQREEIHRLQHQLKHGDTTCDATGFSTKSPTLSYSPVYSFQRIQSTQVPIVKAKTFDKVSFTERPKSSTSHLRQTLPFGQSKSSYTYNLKELQSMSDLNNVITKVNSREKLDTRNEEEFKEFNNLTKPKWDSSRSKSCFMQQYQGDSTATRINSFDMQQWQQCQENKQNQKQQQQSKTSSFCPNSRHTSYLTSEPPALSVAELMRSPKVRWSDRSCHSLSSTPMPNYHPLYPPLPAVGMVAERKKRFEL